MHPPHHSWGLVAIIWTLVLDVLYFAGHCVKHRLWWGSRLEKAIRRRRYRALLPAIQGAAYSCGYAVGVHGSQTRDFDLIAAPWIAEAAGPDTLVGRIAAAIGGQIATDKAGAPRLTEKPHGRQAYVVYTRMAGPHYIDLSVMPRKIEDSTPSVKPQLRIAG